MTTPTTTSLTDATPASIYQQLRGHLAEPTLADAAEALPRVLDQAQTEGWSLTQALEHLLAVEVTATPGAVVSVTVVVVTVACQAKAGRDTANSRPAQRRSADFMETPDRLTL